MFGSTTVPLGKYANQTGFAASPNHEPLRSMTAPAGSCSGATSEAMSVFAAVPPDRLSKLGIRRMQKVAADPDEGGAGHGESCPTVEPVA